MLCLILPPSKRTGLSLSSMFNHLYSVPFDTHRFPTCGTYYIYKKTISLQEKIKKNGTTIINKYYSINSRKSCGFYHQFFFFWEYKQQKKFFIVYCLVTWRRRDLNIVSYAFSSILNKTKTIWRISIIFFY